MGTYINNREVTVAVNHSGLGKEFYTATSHSPNSNPIRFKQDLDERINMCTPYNIYYAVAYLGRGHRFLGPGAPKVCPSWEGGGWYRTLLIMKLKKNTEYFFYLQYKII